MPFKEGKEWKGNKFGRPRGSQNRSSEMMKVNLQRAINGSLDFLASDLQEIREKDKVEAIKLVTKLLDYTLPTTESEPIQWLRQAANVGEVRPCTSRTRCQNHLHSSPSALNADRR